MKSELKRHGTSLVELLVVFFIISIMLGLLLPALQSARNRALTVQCQNNVRQLGFALRHYTTTRKRFPLFEHWTIDVLKYIEEDALADALAHAIPNNGKVARPKLFQCPNQSEVETTIEDVPTCHYVLVVDRPKLAVNPDRYSWDLHDREDLSRSEAPTFRPWYIGPEMTFAQQKQLLATKEGPHGGLYYAADGQTRGGQ
jgi:type II secretory pathway pseudopilin PulG